MALTIHVAPHEIWNDVTEEFEQIPEATFHIEHSLASIAKYESNYRKPFLVEQNMSGKDLINYIRCMTLEENIPYLVYKGISRDDYIRIRNYLEAPMTATWFKEDQNGKKRPGQVITAEIIYYYMVELGIPFECEHWHFNRLMTLIRVCSEKQATPKKMSKKDILSQYASVNAARRAKLGSKG